MSTLRSFKAGVITLTLAAAALAAPSPAAAGGAANSSPEYLTEVGGRLFFSAKDASGRELWVSDGTPGGTHIVKDINPQGSSSPSEITDFGGNAWFVAWDGSGDESSLWRSDGTEEGTTEVVDFEPHELTVVGDRLYFADGHDLWSTDGTPGGTEVAISFAHRYFDTLTDVNGTLYFTSGIQHLELWKTDGTAAATHRLAAVSPYKVIDALTVVDDRLFFALGTPCAPGPICESQLYTSDGTVGGTRRVKDFDGDATDYVFGLAKAGPRLFFTTMGAAWTSDGSASGTRRIKRVPGLGMWSAPTTVGDRVYFWTNDGLGPLWVSDGTRGGTVQVADVGAASQAAAIGSTLFFASAGTPGGSELWKSHGTAAQTRRVEDIRPGSRGSGVSNLSAVGSDLFFVANDGIHGKELWVSDGTRPGTMLVEDINA